MLFNMQRPNVLPMVVSFLGVLLLYQIHLYFVRRAVDSAVIVAVHTAAKHGVLEDWENDASNAELTQDPSEFLVTKINYDDYPSTTLSNSLISQVQTRNEDRKRQVESLYGMNGTRSWIDHISSLPEAGLWPLTNPTQHTINNHQNPASCDDKRFFAVSCTSGQGFGSTSHVMAEALAFAMFHDRILVTIHCEPYHEFVEDGLNPFEILFEPLSSCSPLAIEHPDRIDRVLAPFTNWSYDKLKNAHGICPPSLAKGMMELFPDISANALKLWTRAQMEAYVLRLRPAALAEIATLRLNQDVQKGSYEGKEVSVEFPLPEKSWSIHVRHGDKAHEMKLVPFPAYARRVEQYTMMNPLTSRKYAFVSSEDPAVFDEMKNISSLIETETTHNAIWHWSYSAIARQNTGPFQQLSAFHNKTETTLTWISQLFMALECDGFVGTRNSNWNRLVDELRGVYLPKALTPFLEVSRRRDWVNYHW